MLGRLGRSKTWVLFFFFKYLELALLAALPRSPYLALPPRGTAGSQCWSSRLSGFLILWQWAWRKIRGERRGWRRVRSFLSNASQNTEVVQDERCKLWAARLPVHHCRESTLSPSSPGLVMGQLLSLTRNFWHAAGKVFEQQSGVVPGPAKAGGGSQVEPLSQGCMQLWQVIDCHTWHIGWHWRAPWRLHQGCSREILALQISLWVLLPFSFKYILGHVCHIPQGQGHFSRPLKRSLRSQYLEQQCMKKMLRQLLLLGASINRKVLRTVCCM